MIQYKSIVQNILTVIIKIIGPEPEWKKFANINDDEVKKDLIKVEVLPKKLDEEVAAYMVEGFGGVMTKLSDKQADYINVPTEGPFKTEIYKY